MAKFYVGATVCIRVNIRDIDTGNYVDADSIKITISSGGVIKVDAADMIKTGEGIYAYYYNATAKGFYQYTITGIKDAKNTVERGTFEVV